MVFGINSSRIVNKGNSARLRLALFYFLTDVYSNLTIRKFNKQSHELCCSDSPNVLSKSVNNHPKKTISGEHQYYTYLSEYICTSVCDLIVSYLN